MKNAPVEKPEAEWLRAYTGKKEQGKGYVRLSILAIVSFVVAVSMFWTIRTLEGIEEISGFYMVGQMALVFKIIFWISTVIFVGMVILLIKRRYKKVPKLKKNVS